MLTWEPFYSIPVYVMLAIAIVAVLVLARRIAVSAKTRHWSLFVIRGITLCLLATLLLNPVDRRETVMPPRPPSVALLVDCSQSMGLGVGGSRMERVRRMIGSATTAQKRRTAIEFPLFRFGNQLAKVPGVSELSASEDASRLSEALQRLPSRIADDQTQAVVLFSDGAVSEIDQLQELAEAYREMGVPVHAVLPDEQELLGDVAITALSVPPRVAKGDQATLRAVVESRGFDGQRVVVSVQAADRPNATPLASLPITLADGETACELVVTADPEMGDLVLDVPVQEGEAVANNNRVPFQLGERDRELNVLYMEGTSARESRWLQDALHADPDIKCVAMTVNNQYAERPRLQRLDDPYRGFPATRAELYQYDVVICSDISFKAFTPEQIDWTVDLVNRRGGGFVMIGGFTSFGAGGWDRTPWEGLIPFDMTGRRDYLNQGFRVEVPAAAQSHPIWDIVEDPDRNREVLAAMPPFSGTNLISRVKPAATLLGQTQSSLPRVGVMPIFACESYGRGRTFAMATDTTYGWGSRFEREWGQRDNRYYQKFWRNVVRWLAENSQASQRRLILRTDQVVYGTDDSIELVAEAFDREFNPTTAYRLTAQLVQDAETIINAEPGEGDGSSSDSIKLTARPNAQQYAATLSARLPPALADRSNPMQTASLVVEAWDGEKRVAANSVELQFLRRSGEWLRPQARPDVLELVAESGGGRVLSGQADLESLLQTFGVAPGESLIHKLPIWDRWIVWILLLGLLAAEWILRRRSFAVE